MANRSGRALWLLAVPVVMIVAVVGVYSLFVIVQGRAPEWSSTSVACPQPESVTYEDGTYSVFVRETTFSLSLDSPPLTAVISRTGDGSYGVPIELNSSTDDAEQITCEWTADAVEIVEGNGMIHTVPASVFTGGR
ncbi:hypothetical protein BH10ACT3_BH10ACT3_03940 [soil metagenome]